MALGPYVRPTYSRDASTARMSDLIRSRGEMQARAELERGNINASLIQGIGNTIGSTMADLAKYKMDAPMRQEQAARIADAQHQRSRANNLEGLNTMAGAGKVDPMVRADVLEQEGYFPEAEQVRERRSSAISSSIGRISALKDVTAQTAQALQEVEQDPSAYPRLRPTIIQAVSRVDPQLASAFPETLEPAQVRQLLDFASQTARDADRYERGIKQIAAARQATVTGVEQEQKLIQGVGTILKSARDASSWNVTLDHLRNDHDVPDSILQQAGPWDAEAPARALAMSGKAPEKDATLPRYQDLVARRERELGRPLTAAEADTLTRAPRETGARALTPSERNSAIRDRDSALEAADRELQQATTTRPATAAEFRMRNVEEVVPTAAERAQAKARYDRRVRDIEASYRDQIGEPVTRMAPLSPDQQAVVSRMGSMADLGNPQGQTPVPQPALTGSPGWLSTLREQVTGSSSTAPPTGKNPMPSAGPVQIQAPNGQRMWVPADQVESALRRGATVVPQPLGR